MLRRNLLHTVFETVGTEDMAEIVEAQVSKAKKGDSKAAKIFIDLVNQQSPPIPGNTMNVHQSVIFAEGKAVDAKIETRKIIACMIAFTGPQTTETIALRLFLPGAAAVEALQCDWFERDGGKWGLTNAARSQLLEMPAKVAYEAGIDVAPELG